MFLPFSLNADAAKLIAAGCLVVGSVVSGWHARGVYEDAQMKQVLEGRLRGLEESIVRAEKAANAASEAIGKIKIINQTIQQETRHEVEVREVFKNTACVAPDDTLRVSNRALTGADIDGGPGKSVATLPEPDPSR